MRRGYTLVEVMMAMGLLMILTTPLAWMTIQTAKGPGTSIGRRTVFLDFDGVLHPVDTPALDDGFRLLDSPALFRWRPQLEMLLVAHPDVCIVVSSDWAALFDDAALVHLLGPLGVRFAGIVDRIRGASRADNIRRHVAKHALVAEAWIAIDDDSSVRHAGRSFIWCPPSLGLSDQSAFARVRRWLERTAST